MCPHAAAAAERGSMSAASTARPRATSAKSHFRCTRGSSLSGRCTPVRGTMQFSSTLDTKDSGLRILRGLSSVGPSRPRRWVMWTWASYAYRERQAAVTPLRHWGSSNLTQNLTAEGVRNISVSALGISAAELSVRSVRARRPDIYHQRDLRFDYRWRGQRESGETFGYRIRTCCSASVPA